MLYARPRIAAGNSMMVGRLSGRTPRSRAGMFSRRTALRRLDNRNRYLVAIQNTLRLNMQSLGMEKPERQVPSLKDYLTARAKRVA
jgi:hypothetical protein